MYRSGLRILDRVGDDDDSIADDISVGVDAEASGRTCLGLRNLTNFREISALLTGFIDAWTGDCKILALAAIETMRELGQPNDR